MSRDRAPRRAAPILIAVCALSCGGGGAPLQPPIPSPSPTPVAVPSPSAPPANTTCGLAPGPVTRLAISPREQNTDGARVEIRVRALPNFDEAWCLDKDKDHRLDFNLNQKNADGRECCWVGTPEWSIMEDPGDIVTGIATIDGEGFIGRVRVEPRGRETFFTLEARLDGIRSHPWQSGSGYRREPLKVMTMSAEDIPQACPCIYLGNGQYTGVGCRK